MFREDYLISEQAVKFFEDVYLAGEYPDSHWVYDKKHESGGSWEYIHCFVEDMFMCYIKTIYLLQHSCYKEQVKGVSVDNGF